MGDAENTKGTDRVPLGAESLPATFTALKPCSLEEEDWRESEPGPKEPGARCGKPLTAWPIATVPPKVPPLPLLPIVQDVPPPLNSPALVPAAAEEAQQAHVESCGAPSISVNIGALDLDALALSLAAEERFEADARRCEAAKAAEEAEAAEAQVVSAGLATPPQDGMYGYEMDDAEADEDAPTPNKKLDYNLVAKHLDQSLPSVSKVAGRRVVLLLGNTGVGKSLLLQALVGRSVVRRHFQPSSGLAPTAEAEGMDVEPASFYLPEGKLVWDLEDPLDGFSVGHEMKSETKCIRHYAERDDSVVFLDAAGWNDTAGPEVDVATSIAFKMVADCCAELRFVVLIDCHAFNIDRGGLIRRVADLVLAFVRDFQPPQPQVLAFTFLFTKTDGLPSLNSRTGTAATREEALERLKAALLATMSGTLDGNTKQVLKWMLHCLQKQFPFVDVYNPQFSDISKLRANLESFEQGTQATAIKSPRHDVRCVLTPMVESQIKLDLMTHVEDLRVSLIRARVATGAELLRTLAIFHQHIDKSYVHDAYQKALSLWGEYGTRNVLPQAFQRIDEGMRVDRLWTLEHGRDALRSLAMLRFYEEHEAPDMPHKPAQEALKHLCSGISELSKHMQTGLQEPRTVSALYDASAEKRGEQAFANSIAALGMLRVWGQVHPAFSGAATAAEAAMRAHQAELVQFATSTDDAHPRLLVTVLKQLIICSESEGAFDPAIAALDTRLRNSVSRLVVAAEAALHSEAMCNEELDAYRTSVTCIDEVKHSLSDAVVRPLGDLYEQVCLERRSALGHAKTQLQQMLLGVERMVGALEGCWANVDMSLCHLPALLSAMERLSNTLTSDEHLECQTGILLLQAASSVSIPFRRRLARGQELCEKAMRDSELLPSPEVHVQALSQLESCTWIDAYLSASGVEAFVGAGIEQLNAQYVQLSERTSSVALKALREYLGVVNDAHDDCDRVRASEAVAFTKPTSVLLQLNSSMGSDLVPRICEIASSFHAAVNKAVVEWSGDRFALLDADVDLRLTSRLRLNSKHVPGEVCTIDIDDALGVCEITSELALHLVIELDEKIRKRLAVVNCSMNKIFAAKPKYAPERAAALFALKALHAKGLRRVTAQLPDVDNILKGAAAEVQLQCDAARTAVTQSTGDEDAAHQALSKLTNISQAFKAFDFGQHAQRTAHDLQRELELRSIRVDEVLQTSLHSGDFSNVRRIIEPFIGATDPLKRPTLDQTLDATKETLQQRSDNANASLAVANEAGVQRVAETIRILDDAAKHLGDVLRDERGFDVPALSAMLKNRVVARLEGLIENLNADVHAQRFASVIEGAAVTKAFLKTLPGYVEPPPQPAPHPVERESNYNQGGFFSNMQRDAERAFTAIGRSLGSLVGGNSSSNTHASPEHPSAAPTEPQSSGAKGDTPVLRSLTNRAQEALVNAEQSLTSRIDEKVMAFVAHVQSSEMASDCLAGAMLCKALQRLKASCDGCAQATAAKLSERYNTVTLVLTHALGDKLAEVKQQAKRDCLVAYGLAVFRFVARELSNGLQDHVQLQVDVQAAIKQLEVIEAEAAKHMRNGLTVEQIARLKLVFDRLERESDRCSRDYRVGAIYEYIDQKKILGDHLRYLFNTTRAAIDAHNYALAGESVAVIREIFAQLAPYFKPATAWNKIKTEWVALEHSNKVEFSKICEHLKGALAQGDAQSFELAVRWMHSFEERLPAAFVKAEAQLVHEAVHMWLTAQVQVLLKQLDETGELVAAADSVLRLRRVGHVFVSTWALYTELATESGRHRDEGALTSISKLTNEHFGGQALVLLGKEYAVLELDENATKQDVERAFRSVSWQHHPDKQGNARGDAMQKRVSKAKETLSDKGALRSFWTSVQKPFSAHIKKVPVALRVRLDGHLQEHEYDKVRAELISLKDLPDLLALVEGIDPSACSRPEADAHKAVKEHMQMLRSEVERMWEQSNFKELNHMLTAVDKADMALAAYEDFYSPAWAKRIRESLAVSYSKR